VDRPHALILLVAACSAETTETRPSHAGTLATLVISAPGDTGEGFHDVQRAVDGVRGGGQYAGGMDVFSLGDDDELVLGFEEPVPDGEGFDLAVFENPFDVRGGDGRFVDPAVVEVSADCEAFVAFPATYAGVDYEDDPALWSGFAGIEPVLLHEEENPVDALSDEAGGDRFDLAEVGLDEVACVRITSGVAWGFPADPVSDGPDIDGVYGR
jgi:hypothetical protein